MDKPRQRGGHSDTKKSSVPQNSVMVKLKVLIRNVPDFTGSQNGSGWKGRLGIS